MKPNLVYVFSDQHRVDATGYHGNPDVKTPVMDQMAERGVHFELAISNTPICSPARASLLTGQRTLTNGVFLNDVSLNPDALTIGKVMKREGYNTAYIGKWHLDGHGREAFIPKERRHDFDFWRVLECTHHYNDSYYYGDEPNKLMWEGYDAEEQTKCAIQYIKDRDKNEPFALFLSWGPPHSPYHTAPERFRKMYDEKKLILRPNVPPEQEEQARTMLAGYYAHISALDESLGQLWETLQAEGIEDNTIFVYASDHGDMIGSQGEYHKLKPWDESIRIPFLLRYPAMFGHEQRMINTPFSLIDIMPTLLDLCGIEIPNGVEGVNFGPYLRGEQEEPTDAALIECVHPFGQWSRQNGGKEYRGIRTKRYTYVRDLNGPWLLYDNLSDPYQLHNLINSETENEIKQQLDQRLNQLLDQFEDEFVPSEHYLQRWGYTVSDNGTILK